MRDWVDEHVERWQQEIPDLDPVTEQITARLAVVSKELSRRRQASLDRYGLELWQFKTMLALRRRGKPYRATPTELAEELGVTRAAMTKRLDGLEREGYVERLADSRDRRSIEITLTPKGRRALESASGAEAVAEQELLAPLSERQREQLVALLRRIVAGADLRHP